ncbi:MAG: hypothetical protein ACK4IA_13685 [Paracoccus hibiscisoli]|uniref:hypothetical protein n=1 Tax=Paracoccus hibiscisoli TaxID=2023261 RepID=UPI00391B2892
MLAFRLVLHALRQLTDNARTVLLLGWPSLFLAIALEFALFRPWDVSPIGPGTPEGLIALELEGREAMPAGIFLAGQAAAFVAYLLLAVSWHRHILLAEQPQLLRRGRARQAGGYALAFALMGLLVGVAIVPFVIILSAPSAGYQLSMASAVSWYAVKIAATTLSLRLMTALPGFALRSGEPLAAAWRATRGRGGTLAIIATLTVTMGPLASPWTALIMAGALQLGLLGASVLSGMLSLLGMLIALSVLTTLWGHFVEGRALR